MTVAVFEVLTEAERLGHDKTIASGVVTAQPGLLAKLDSGGSTLSLGSVSDVFGIFFGMRYSTYRPTTKIFAEGEPCVALWGAGEALISSDFFVGGSLPVANDALYAQAAGLWGMQGSTKVGECVGRVSRNDSSTGLGTAQTLAHVRFNIQP